MQTLRAARWLTLCPTLLVLAVAVRGGVHDLSITVTPRFAGQPLVFDALAYTTVTGQRIAVTRLDFLLWNFALRRADGTWHAQPNSFAYISGRDGRTTFRLSDLPAGRYDRIRFHVGVPEKENHADPAGLAANHPLNPNLNGLHWNWQGGYVFMAIEGAWSEPGRGYSWHLATDRLLMNVELPIQLELAGHRDLRLALNVDQIFSGAPAISISDENTSTHSRPGDMFAVELRGRVERAFAVDSTADHLLPPPGAKAQNGHRQRIVLIASNATPYRFVFARYFPQPALPSDNPLTEEGVELGRRLFHDSRLSINNRQSCASCHQAEAGFTDGRRFSVGAAGQVGPRNAMPLFNLAWRHSFFWDGRAPSLREQVLMPIENALEMHESLSNVVAKLSFDRRRNEATDAGRAGDESLLERAGTNDYPAGFARAFGTPDITADRLARALEQFVLTLVSHHSKFDRSLAGAVELSAEERRGLELFHTEYDPRRGQFGADCFHCHGGPLFQSQGFANNGLDETFADLGRYEATRRAGDRGRFAVPSLRNIARTAPYMHDGRFASLEEVVEHYATGVKRSATLDPNLAKHPDGGVPLSTEDKRALVAFLKTLTDEPSGAQVTAR